MPSGYELNEGNVKYPSRYRMKASELFLSGFGYKAAAILGIPQGTVRDWKRQWEKGHFNERNLTYAESVRQIMIETDQCYVWRDKVDILASAYRLVNGYDRKTLTSIELNNVMSSLKHSRDFCRLPIKVWGYDSYRRQVAHDVYRLNRTNKKDLTVV